MLKLIILDRDGVINYDSSAYIKSPAEWHAIPNSLTAIAKLNQAGIKVCVATNQSGIARGYYNLATLTAIHKKMQFELAQVNGHIDAIFFCPHGPDDGCDCRKPKPGLYQQALHHFSLQAHEALVIGDALRDVIAAINVGCPAIMLTSKKQEAAVPTDVKVYVNLTEAVKTLLKICDNRVP